MHRGYHNCEASGGIYEEGGSLTHWAGREPDVHEFGMRGFPVICSPFLRALVHAKDEPDSRPQTRLVESIL
jgi:hypothetical protein